MGQGANVRCSILEEHLLDWTLHPAIALIRLMHRFHVVYRRLYQLMASLGIIVPSQLTVFLETYKWNVTLHTLIHPHDQLYAIQHT